MTDMDDPVDAARQILDRHRIVIVSGRQGIGKSTFAFNVGNALIGGRDMPLLGVSGNQYRQYTSFHPFEHKSYLEALKKSGGSIIRVGTTVATAIDPIGQILHPTYEAIKYLVDAQKSASTGFTKAEVEGARNFATIAKTQRVFLFDNFHFWDNKSLEFARKVIISRKPLCVYVIIVWTEHDVVQSANEYKDVLANAPRFAKYHYCGLPEGSLRNEFLHDLPDAHANIILNVAGANIPLIKQLKAVVHQHPHDPNLATRIANSAVNLKFDSLMDIPGIQNEQRALGCVAVVGSGTSVRDIACALDLSADETVRVLEWGERHGLINILSAHQVAFVHDLYQRLFDDDEILESRFLEKINLCCALGIPDEYEKRAEIASRGHERDFTLALVISFLRQRMLSWNETKDDISVEVDQIKDLIGGKYSAELDKLAHMLNAALEHASKGEFEKAASRILVSTICSNSHAHLEEAVLFAHYAYLSRDNTLREFAIQRLNAVKDTAKDEAERSFIVSMMLAYGLSLGNRLKEATAIFAQEEARLAVSSDRFKDAVFYIAICERMSLTCYENSLARRRLERAFQTFQQLLEEHGFLKRPDELLKCASNLCSAYVIGGMPDRAEDVLQAVGPAVSDIDYSWSTAPAFLVNNSMVAAIHQGQTDFEDSAETWHYMARSNAHVQMPFLVNALGCFIEAETPVLGKIAVSTIINDLEEALTSMTDGEAFMSYIAHFTIWQAIRTLNLDGDAEVHLKQASDYVLEIPYVNGDYFRMRHNALVNSVQEDAGFSSQAWQAIAFDFLPDSQLPVFYRRVVHFNPLEHWLPS
ncbi:MAG: hypothetical protein J4F49_08825 [Rhodobacteraceae bacterium]|nr:hypothetical protein [Paracoccaceae bacterium]